MDLEKNRNKMSRERLGRVVIEVTVATCTGGSSNTITTMGGKWVCGSKKGLCATRDHRLVKFRTSDRFFGILFFPDSINIVKATHYYEYEFISRCVTTLRLCCTYFISGMTFLERDKWDVIYYII